MKWRDLEEDYGVRKYSFHTEEGQLPEEVVYISCRDGKFIEVEYVDGRTVRYIYNKYISER